MKKISFAVIILGLIGCAQKGEKKLSEARFLYIDSRFGEALEAYNQALSENPKLLEAHTGIISACFKLEKGDSIVAVYDSLSKEHPDDPAYSYTYGLALRVGGQLDSALTLYQKALDMGLKHGRVYSSIGYIYELRDEKEAAEKWYHKAMEKRYADAFFSLAELKEDEKERESLMKRGLQCSKEFEKGRHYLAMAHFYLEKDDSKMAEEWLHKADEWGREHSLKSYKDKHLVYPLRYEADQLLRQGLYDKAIEKYKEALKAKEDDVDTHFGLGWAYYRNGLYDDALKEYKAVLEISFNHTGALKGIAVIYADRGQYSLAEAYYDRCRRIDPCTFNFGNLAILYIAKGEYNKALEVLDQGLAVNPRNAHLYLVKGYVLSYKGEYDEAIENYQKAERLGLREDILTSHLYYQMAYVYYKRDLTGNTLPKATKWLCLSYLQKSLDAYRDNKDAEWLYSLVSRLKERE